MDQGTLILLSTIGVTLLFLIGVPIFLVIGFWVVAVSVIIDFTLANIGRTFFQGISSFALLALPLFVLTGDLIKAGGIAKQLTDFADALLGRVRGGMGMSTLGACGLFSAISGSNTATTATIGSIMYPELVKRGYDRRFAAATAGAGGTVGIIIPPSIIFIVYGYIMNLSIIDLFLSGLIPGIIMLGAMMIACYIVTRRMPSVDTEPFSIRRVARTGLRAYIGFFTIFFILYGIYTGLFSPTEAASVAVGFVFFAGLLLTRELKLRNLPEILLNSGRITGILAPLIAVSVVMQQMLSLLGFGAMITGFLTGLGDYFLVLAACMAIVFITGMILESLPVTIILAPILAPIAHSIGVDPIHFGVIFLMGAAIGFVTPPYGLNLYVASGITGVPYLQLVPFVMPYVLALIIAWIIVVLFPPLALLFV